MADDLPMVERIRANAAKVLALARAQLDEEVGYDGAGVRWLDGYIQRQHERGDPAEQEVLVSALGAYLGECIIRNIGGEWAEREGWWHVRFDDRNSASPFSKVRKQLKYGEEDSVLCFYALVAMFFSGHGEQANHHRS
jgi:hypothetical protein